MWTKIEIIINTEASVDNLNNMHLCDLSFFDSFGTLYR